MATASWRSGGEAIHLLYPFQWFIDSYWPVPSSFLGSLVKSVMYSPSAAPDLVQEQSAGGRPEIPEQALWDSIHVTVDTT